MPPGLMGIWVIQWEEMPRAYVKVMLRVFPLDSSYKEITQSTLGVCSEGQDQKLPMPGRLSAILCSIHCHFFHAQPGPKCWDLEMQPPLSWSVASGPSRSGASPSKSHLPSMSSSSLDVGALVSGQLPRARSVTELGVAASAPTLLRLLFPAPPSRSVDRAHCLH